MKNITKLDFILPLLFREKILRAVRLASKLLQTATVDLSSAVPLLETAVKSVAGLRDNFEQLSEEAKTVTTKWHVDAKFEDKRKRTVNFFSMNWPWMNALKRQKAASEWAFIYLP